MEVSVGGGCGPSRVQGSPSNRRSQAATVSAVGGVVQSKWLGSAGDFKAGGLQLVSSELAQPYSEEAAQRGLLKLHMGCPEIGALVPNIGWGS